MFTNSEINGLGKKMKQLYAEGKDLQCLTNSDKNMFLDWRLTFAEPMRQLYCTLNTQYPTYKSSCRIKRMESIFRKVNYKLTSMHDIAGVRVVTNNLNELCSLKEECEKLKSPQENTYKIVSSSLFHDYSTKPRNGYRSVHFDVQLRDDVTGRCYHVELQLRTKLQHAWAQAVEAIDSIESTDVKHNPDKDKFWILLSALIAYKEGDGTLIPEGKSYKDLEKELININDRRQYLEKLRLFSHETLIENPSSLQRGWNLIIHDLGEQEGRVVSFNNLDDLKREYIKEGMPDYPIVYTDDPDNLPSSYSAYYPQRQSLDTVIKLIENLYS